jgi:hypothetical protein
LLNQYTGAEPMRVALLLVPALAPLLTLAACDSGGTGTSISFTGNTDDGNGGGATMNGATGEVKVDVPGFQGSFKLPKIQMTADNFDLNGVHLPPGSKIRGFNVDAGESAKDDGKVTVAFDAPTDAAGVRSWFNERLPKAGYAVHADGSGLVGTTDDKKPFVLKLDEGDAGHAKGTITIG